MEEEDKLSEDLYVIDDEEEELSYSGYADGVTVEKVVGGAYFTGDEEDHYYSAFGDDADTAFASVKEAVHSGDFIVEELSPKVNAKGLHRLMHIPEDAVLYIFSTVYIIIGVLCVSITDYMTLVLPYIVGGLVGIVGVVRFIYAVIQKEYVHTHSNKTASSLILMALAIVILIDLEWANRFIPMVWGVLGLFEAAHAFNHGISRISRGMNSSYYLIKGIVELVLAFLLMYDPLEHLGLHIIVFGVQLIFRGVTAIPALKARLARR